MMRPQAVRGGGAFGGANGGVSTPSKLGRALRSVDFYRKVPREFSEGTVGGSVISILSAVVMTYLLVSEIYSYSATTFDTKVVVDRSIDGELLRINFNVSFPALSCEFASVDVGDAMGLNRFNLTKTVFKRAIDAEMNPIGPLQWDREVRRVLAASDAEREEAAKKVEAHKRELAVLRESNTATDGRAHAVYEIADLKELQAMVRDPTHAVVLVNFYAPWCPYCKRLEPIWNELPSKLEEAGSKTRVARMNVDTYTEYASAYAVTGFPTLMLFENGRPVGAKTGLVDMKMAMRYAGVQDEGILAQFTPEKKLDKVLSGAQIEYVQGQVGAVREELAGIKDVDSRARALEALQQIESIVGVRTL